VVAFGFQSLLGCGYVEDAIHTIAGVVAWINIAAEHAHGLAPLGPLAAPSLARDDGEIALGLGIRGRL
jgi:hypothetical protein